MQYSWLLTQDFYHSLTRALQLRKPKTRQLVHHGKHATPCPSDGLVFGLNTVMCVHVIAHSWKRQLINYTELLVIKLTSSVFLICLIFLNVSSWRRFEGLLLAQVFGRSVRFCSLAQPVIDYPFSIYLNQKTPFN